MSTEFSTELSPLLPHGQMVRAGERAVNVKRLFRLRGPLMATVTLALAIPLVAVVWFSVPAEYEATTYIQVHSVVPSVLEEGKTTPGSEYDKFVQTQVRMITGSPILSKVADDPAVYQLEWVQDQRDLLYFLMRKVEAEVERGSELIRVSCTSPDREAALTIVSRTAEIYSKEVANLESKGVGNRRTLLVEQRESLEEQIRMKRAEIATLKKQAGITIEGSTPTGEIGLEYYHDKLGQAQAELTSAETAISNLEFLISQVQKLQAKHRSSPTQAIHEMGIESRVESDTAVELLRSSEAATAQHIADLEGRYVGEAAPLKSQRDALESIRHQLEEAKATVRGSILASQLEEFRLELTTERQRAEDAKARSEQFQETVDTQEKKLEAMAQAMAAIEEEEALLELFRKNYDGIREQIRVLDVEERAPGRVDEPAETTAPERPHYGRRLQFLLVVLVASGTAGLGAGLWRELADTTIRSPQDVSLAADLPLLAAIPHASADKIPKEADPAMVTADYPGSTISDEYRRVITRIIYPPEGSAELNTVLIVSPSRGDGKTSLACNLAVALSQADRRVLVVDISARRPRVESSFGLVPAKGLGEVLEGTCRPDDVVRETRFPNLCVLGPGIDREDAIGKLASRDAVEFLENAEKAFEHVVIDTPPSLLMSDAKLLAPIVDGVLVVVGAEVSSLGMVRRCVGELRQIGANIVGAVLNGIRPARGGYLRENLSSYYAYADGGPGDRAAHPSARRSSGSPAPPGEESRESDEASIVLLNDTERSDDAATDDDRRE